MDIRGEADRLGLRATGSEVKFPGFLAALGPDEGTQDDDKNGGESPTTSRGQAAVLDQLQVQSAQAVPLCS